MARGKRQTGRFSGGIVSLVLVMDKHASALDYDLMTRTGRSTAEWAALGATGIVALAHFVKQLDISSRTYAEMHDSAWLSGWSMRIKTNALLADLFDAVNALRYAYVASVSKRKPDKPKPYPRPWHKSRDKGTKHYGRDGIPIKDFKKWWSDGK